MDTESVDIGDGELMPYSFFGVNFSGEGRRWVLIFGLLKY